MMRRMLGGAAILMLASGAAQAAEKLTFMSSWKAQAEHGGYYQAIAKGFYKACDIDLTFRQGGPGVDGKQLLVGGAIDMMMASYSDIALLLNVQGFEAKAVAAMFQKTPQILMVHADSPYKSIEDMKGKPIMIAASSRTTFWPFLRSKYGYEDTQIRPYSGQIAPWLTDKLAIQQGIITNEPYLVESETGAKPRSFLLADLGYATYSSMILTSKKLIDAKPKMVQCFVDATIKGYIDFLKDPAPAVELIRKDNPMNPDGLVNYSIAEMKARGIIETEDTQKYGIGAMTDARWKAHTDLLKEAGIVPKDFDEKTAYTLQFVNKRVGM